MTAKRIVIAGGTGLLGRMCVKEFRKRGYETCVLTRGTSDPNKGLYHWDVVNRKIEANVIEGAYAIVNLTGMPLDAKRWNAKVKQQLIQSRVEPAKFLDALIKEATTPPEIYVGASAVGVYGDSGPAPVDENSEVLVSNHFISLLSRNWEKAHPQQDGLRTTLLRIAVVMTMDGGFLPTVLAPAKLGAYGFIGNGKQYMSWIHIDDLVASVVWAVENQSASGIYNASAGGISAKSLMQEILKARGGIGIVAGMPGFVAKVALGEVAEFLMWGCNASGDKLRDEGFDFKHDDIESALHDLLG